MDNLLDEERRKAEEEQIKMWVNYLSMVFAQPSMDKPSAKYKKAKNEFENAIKPQISRRRKKKKYEWDFERQARLEKG